MADFQHELKNMGVRIVKSDKDFVEENKDFIKYMLTVHSVTSKVFNTALGSGFNKIKIDSKKGQFINENNANLKFLYAVDNWFLLVDLDKKRLLLYKIE